MIRAQSVLESMFGEVTDGVCVSDLSQGILYLNAAAERMLEITLPEARGRSLCETLCGRMKGGHGICKDECSMLRNPREAKATTLCGKQGPTPSFKWSGGMMHRAELWRHLRVRCQEMPLAVPPSWGKDIRLTIIEDVSDEVDLQEQKKDWQSMLVHDLRTPLSSIFTVLRTFQDEELGIPEKERKLLDISVRACRRMMELLNLYLDVAKLESGSMPVSPTPVDLAELVKIVTEEQIALVSSKHLTVTVEVPADLRARADYELLFRIVQNLVNNAIKFTPDGGRVLIGGERLNDGRASLFIKDNGPGIDPTEIPKLFDRFHQAKARREGKVQGTGLGLAFCLEAARAMGGDLTVETELGAGSKFSIMLEGAAVEPSAAAARQEVA
ncbi:MAG: PAS domain-containing sensor histidine kinase [Elusimicrobia bacterium]|nr:PAS domain-containing sensor histidine kinase [Elusimicrobiota bacterium]